MAFSIPPLPPSPGAVLPPVEGVAHDGLPGYAELCCLSNFSFLKGASQPEELVDRAWRLGYSALALTDECSMAGVVRAYAEYVEDPAAKTLDDAAPDTPPWPRPRLLIGSQFVVHEDDQAPDPDQPHEHAPRPVSYTHLTLPTNREV